MQKFAYKLKVQYLAPLALLAVAGTASAATLQLSPSTKSVNVGDTFTVDVMLDTQGASIDGVDVHYLNYNPYYLQLQDADSAAQGTQIQAGSLMPNTVINSGNATDGKIDFSQITSSGTKYSGSGVLAKLTFKALVAGSTNVTFDYTSGKTTDSNVASEGNDVLNSVTNSAVTINYPNVPSGGTDSTSTNTSTYTVHLINRDGTFYLVYGGARHGVTSPGILYSWGFEFKDALQPTSADLALSDGDILLPGDGALVKTAQDPTVYLISEGQKHGFTSAQVFTGLGFKFSEVLVVTQPELNKQPVGSLLNNTTDRHLDGVHINDHGTVYWVSGGQKWAYPSQAVYNSWRRDNYFGDVVPANSADVAMPLGGIIPLRVNQ